MNLFEFQLLKHSATGQSFSEDSSDLQAALHDLTVRFLVLIVLYFALNVNYEHETILSLFILLRQFSPYLNHHFLFFAGISCRSG